MGHARYRSGIAVAVDSPFESMADLIDAGRSGKELNYAATDALGAITMVRLGNTTCAQFKWIRYMPGQEAATAIMGGFVDVLIGSPTAIPPHLKTVQLRPLDSAHTVRWHWTGLRVGEEGVSTIC